MRKLVIAITAVLLLAGCQGAPRITVEDNSPTEFERKNAMRDCVAQFDVSKAPEPLRIACTQAVYGGYK